MQSSALNEDPSDGPANDLAGADAWRRGMGASLLHRSRRATTLAAGVVVLATVAAFSNSFAGPFIFDDLEAVTNNTTIKQLWPIGNVLCPPHDATVTGRPLLNLSLALNYAVGGTNVRGYHVVNLAIHLVAALLLLGILRRTFLLPAMRERWQVVATPLALAIALLWAIHPLQTESVTYVVQRAESLMGLLYLLTLYCFLRGVDAARAGFWYVGSVAACLLGMVSKEVMVSAPLIVLLYDRTFVAGSFRAAWRRRWGLYLALAATWLLLGWMVVLTGNHGGTAGFGLSVSCWSYLCTQFGAIVHYLRLCVWPHPLVLDYGAVILRNAAEIVPYAIVIGLLGAATVVALRRWPKVGFLGAWFFAILAPTSSFMPACVTQTIAEHRMYLPLAAVVTGVVLGACFAGQWLVGRWKVSRFGLRVAGVLLLIAVASALGIVTFQRNAIYAGTLSIWRDTVATAPENCRAQYSFGLALADRGQADAAIPHLQKAVELRPDSEKAHNNLGIVLAGRGQIDAAIAQYQEALKLKPDYAEAYNNLGNALGGRGQADAAIAQFEKALELKPDYAEAYNNLGSVLGGRGQMDAAIAQFEKALELKPDFAKAHNNLANVLGGRGQVDAAIAHYQKALEIEPGYAEIHNNLANALAGRGQIDAAIVHYQKALEIKPDFMAAHYNLGLALANRGQLSAAIAHYQNVLELMPNFAEAHCNLGIALAGCGQFDAAIAHFQKALELKPDYADARRNCDIALARRKSLPSQPPARP